MAGFNKNKKKTLEQPNLESAIRPVAQFKELPVLLFTTLPGIEEAGYISLPDHTKMSRHDNCRKYEEPSYGP